MEIITDKATSFNLVERCYALRSGTMKCAKCVFLNVCADATTAGSLATIRDFLYSAEEVKADG